MQELVALAFLLSIDNVRLAAALGLLGRSGFRWWRIAVWMALLEGLSPLLGAAVLPVMAVQGGSLERLGVVMLMLAAVLSLVGALKHWHRSVPSWMLYLLPVVFAFDNAAAGAGLAGLGYGYFPTALLVGSLSAAVSLGTMFASGRFARFLGGRWKSAPAALALAVGATFLVLA